MTYKFNKTPEKPACIDCIKAHPNQCTECRDRSNQIANEDRVKMRRRIEEHQDRINSEVYL